MNQQLNVNTDLQKSQAGSAKSPLFPINEIRQHAVEIQDRAGDACTLLRLASEKLASVSAKCSADQLALAGIDCLIRSACRALGQIDEAAASTSLAVEDFSVAVEGGAS